MRVLVIGDAILDIYVECLLKKMCPEDQRAPALIKDSVDTRPGGAANVAVNLAELSPGTQVDLIAVLDDDLARVIKWDGKNRVNMEWSVFDLPLTKTRYLLPDGRIVARIDNQAKISDYAAGRLYTKLSDYLSEHVPDLILLSDYAGGALSDPILATLLRVRERLIIDTKVKDLSVFSEGGRTLGCKLNRDEWADALQRDSTPERHFKFLVVTRGEKGARLHLHRREGEQDICSSMDFEGFRACVEDTNGCGDSFLAGFAASFLRNRDPFTATDFGNAAGAVVVSKERTAIAGLGEVLGVLGVVKDEVGSRSVGAYRRDPASRID